MKSSAVERGKPSSTWRRDRTAAAQELGSLLMVLREWTAAREVLQRAESLAPADPHTRSLLGLAQEGAQDSISTVKATLQSAGDALAGTVGASDWGNDTHVIDIHHGGRTGEHMSYGRSWPVGEDAYRQAATEATADMAAYFTWLRLAGLEQPMFRAVAGSRGPEPYQLADTLEETVARFAEADVVILRGVLPTYVNNVVRDYYIRFTGKCEHQGAGRPVKCDKPESMVFGTNPNDPDVRNAYSDRVGWWLNQFLRPLVEAIAGHRLNPIYAYLARYLDKPVGLQAHTDMIDNEYTLTTQLHQTPEGETCPIYVQKTRLKFEEDARNLESMCPHFSDPEPHCIEPGDGVGGVLQPGDSVLFRGRQHIHWRPKWPKGTRTCMSVLVHFVPRETTIDRGAHNKMVCCAWPPLPEFNSEDCECSDRQMNRAKRKLKKLLPLRDEEG